MEGKLLYPQEKRNWEIRARIDDGSGYRDRAPGGPLYEGRRHANGATIAGALFAIGMGLIAVLTWVTNF